MHLTQIIDNTMKTNAKIMFFLPLLVISFLSCTKDDVDPTDPKAAYVNAKEYFDDESYDLAIQKFREFKARFPYSQYAAEADLLIADSEFELSQFIEAATSYEQFVKLHPLHPKLDYAMYRVGLSYWQEAPDTPDRDQDFTYSAIKAWEDMLQQKKDSPLAPDAQKKIIEGKDRLSKTYQFIAKFYCKMEIYHACAYRYVKLMKKFPEFKALNYEAALMTAKAFEMLAKGKSKDPESDKNFYYRDLTPEKLQALSVEFKKKAEEFK